VRLVEDADRRQHQAGSDGGGGREGVVEVGLLDRYLAPGLPALDPGVLHLQLRTEGDALVEGVGYVHDEPREVRLARGIGPAQVVVLDLAVAAEGGVFLVLLLGRGEAGAELGEGEGGQREEAEGERGGGAHKAFRIN